MRRPAIWACFVSVALCGLVQAQDKPPAAKDWSDPIKHPTDWLKLEADLRLRHTYLNNPITLNQDAPGHEWNFERYRIRVGATATPVKDLDLTARITWEGRHWWEPETRDEWQNNDVLFDLLYAHWKSAFGIPLDLKVGRQEIILGDGWLVLEGTPLDGSRTIYFDAARATIGLKEIDTTVDLIYLQTTAEPISWMSFLGERDLFVAEQDEQGGIVYVTNKSLKTAQIDGYYIFKENDRVLPNGDEGVIHTFGGRTAVTLAPDWKLLAEGAYQTGHLNGRSLQAWGAQARLKHEFLIGDMKAEGRIEYEYRSGDDPDTDDDEAFRPLWSRWPAWSELYIYTYAGETRIAEVTNVHRASVGATVAPMRDMQVSFNYHLLFADQNTFGALPGFDSSGDFRGQIFQAVLLYQFNRHISGHLWAEHFLPGNYYDNTRDDAATFLRAQLVFAL